MKPSPSPRFTAVKLTARTVALQVLFEVRAGDGFVQEVLDHHLSTSELAPPDRRLATQLAYGVLRRQGTLDVLLRPSVSRPPDQVEPWLWDVLRLGAFQLALLTHVPAHAALNETVELAASLGRPQAKGFINGVLRTVSRLLTDERGDRPAADMLPLELGVYRKLAKGALPDVATSPVEYVAAAFGLPVWLARRWSGRVAWDELLRLGFWFAGQSPTWLRVNRLRIDRPAFLKALDDAGIRAEAGAHEQAVRLLDAASIRDLPGYAEGWFAVQDHSAMTVASALAPEPGSYVLDRCSAPGGKTTHLAELMGNRGRISACDVDARRLATVASLCRRLGVTIVEPLRLHPERNEESPAGPFDAALVDVPCSNTGVLGRRPEARWRLSENDFRRLVPFQTKLLTEALEGVRSGGVVVYSTCSIEPEENQMVVRNVLRTMPEWTLEAEEEQVPGKPADGGYWARVRRKNGASGAKS